jgi:DNA polymerase-3 subunit delta
MNIGISKDFNTFELNDALSKRDVVKANRIVNYFAANSKEHPLVLTIASLNSFFVKLLRYHGLEDKSKESAARALGVNPFFVNDYVQAARNYPMQKIKSIVGNLREYDLRSKGIDNVSADDGELMKELIWKILH